MITCTFENGNIAEPGLRHITVNTIVIKDNQVLMGLRAAVPGLTMLEVGKWALIGGFYDRDETLLDAVKREVMEESGWEIDNIKLFRINDSPDRPIEDRQNVDMIYVAQAVKQVGVHDQEVKELRWFPLGSLPPHDQIAFDHGDSLELYQKYLSIPCPLPIIG
jgi:ADP-ribose pyrophosphatase YjhB (NUDIX family)